MFGQIVESPKKKAKVIRPEPIAASPPPDVPPVADVCLEECTELAVTGIVDTVLEDREPRAESTSVKRKQKTKHISPPSESLPDWQAFSQGLYNAFMALRSSMAASPPAVPPVISR